MQGGLHPHRGHPSRPGEGGDVAAAAGLKDLVPLVPVEEVGQREGALRLWLGVGVVVRPAVGPGPAVLAAAAIVFAVAAADVDADAAAIASLTRSRLLRSRIVKTAIVCCQQRTALEFSAISALISCFPIVCQVIKKFGGIVIRDSTSFHNTTHIILPENIEFAPYTFKTILGLSMGVTFVTQDWLEASVKKNGFVSTKDHNCDHLYFEDDRYPMRVSIQNGKKAAANGGLLSGYHIYFCPGIIRVRDNLSNKKMNSLIKAWGANRLNSPQQLTNAATHNPEQTLIILADSEAQKQGAKSTIEDAKELGASVASYSKLIKAGKHQDISILTVKAASAARPSARTAPCHLDAALLRRIMLVLPPVTANARPLPSPAPPPFPRRTPIHPLNIARLKLNPERLSSMVNLPA